MSLSDQAFEAEGTMLSTEDRLAIQSLYARYCTCFDLGDVQGWVDCFTQDGVFKTANDFRGHAQLRAFVEGRIEMRGKSPDRNVQHWTANTAATRDCSNIALTLY